MLHSLRTLVTYLACFDARKEGERARVARDCLRGEYTVKSRAQRSFSDFSATTIPGVDENTAVVRTDFGAYVHGTDGVGATSLD